MGSCRTTNLLKVRQSIISGNGADGADLAGTGLTDNIFENNLIFNNTGYGVDVGSGVTRTGVRLNHTFSGNTLGATRDLGTGTFIETPAGGASATELALQYLRLRDLQLLHPRQHLQYLWH